jgi:hypothetical protein
MIESGFAENDTERRGQFDRVLIGFSQPDADDSRQIQEDPVTQFVIRLGQAKKTLPFNFVESAFCHGFNRCRPPHRRQEGDFAKYGMVRASSRVKLPIRLRQADITHPGR